MHSFNHKKWSIFFVLLISFNSCFGLQIRNSELDIKKKNEPNGYLKIIISGDIGNSNPYVRINLTENYPKVKRRIPIIYSEDSDTIYSLEGKLENKETLIPIKQGEYFASIVNEEEYSSGAFFIFPILLQEDKYVGISFGMGEEFNETAYTGKNTKCHISKERRNYFISPVFVTSDIQFNRCPKLKIQENKITEVHIDFSKGELLVWTSISRVIPGIIIGLPIYGTLVYKSNSIAEIKYPDETKVNTPKKNN